MIIQFYESAEKTPDGYISTSVVVRMDVGVGVDLTIVFVPVKVEKVIGV